MLLLEAIAAIILICAVAGAVAAGVTALAALKKRRTLEGKIEKKRDELTAQGRYILELRSRHSDRYSPRNGEIVAQYMDLAEKKYEQTRTQLEALLLEKERRDFEEHMKGNR